MKPKRPKGTSGPSGAARMHAGEFAKNLMTEADEYLKEKTNQKGSL